MKTVFSVKGQGYTIDGVGQDAASAIIKAFPNQKVFLIGFLTPEGKILPSEV